MTLAINMGDWNSFKCRAMDFECTSRVVLVSIFEHACVCQIRICHVAEYANDPIWQEVEFLEDQVSSLA
jgi:hypothetical protein